MTSHGMRRTQSTLLRCTVLLLTVLATRSAYAEVIFDSGLVAFSKSGTQFNRITRDKIASDWASAKTFPGVLRSGPSLAYEAFEVDSGIYSYIQILLDDPTASLFVSAYDGAFAPIDLAPNFGLDTNYLGDPGDTQPFGNPSFFQLVVPRYSRLVIVINELILGSGTGRPFELVAEGFFDVDYNDITTEPDPGEGGGGGGTPGTPVPEPPLTVLTGASVLLAASRRWKRSRSALHLQG